jgi:hypothetical protein
MKGWEVFCDECFRRKWPSGHEERTCVCGMMAAVSCIECGAVREAWGQKPYWHCVSGAKELVSSPKSPA